MTHVPDALWVCNMGCRATWGAAQHGVPRPCSARPALNFDLLGAAPARPSQGFPQPPLHTRHTHAHTCRPTLVPTCTSCMKLGRAATLGLQQRCIRACGRPRSNVAAAGVDGDV
eukprot:212284-Chlamydomonas_euryale.AAC.7